MCLGKAAFERLSGEVRAKLRGATTREEALLIMEEHRDELAAAFRSAEADARDAGADGCGDCPMRPFEEG